MKKLHYYLMVFITIIFIFTGCSTSKKSIMVFGNQNQITKLQNISNIPFNTVLVIENVFPPANLVCLEFNNFTPYFKQCTKYVTWEQFLNIKYPNSKLIKMDYNYKDKTMLLYLKNM